MSNINVLPALVAASVAGTLGTLLFLHWKERKNEGQQSDVSVRHLKVPRETAAIIIGREGKNLKAIENQTNTVISFIDPGGPFRICVIRGKPDDIQLAEELVTSTVRENAKTETVDFFVTQAVLTRLTSNNNEQLRLLTLQSKARVYVDMKLTTRPGGLLIRGTPEQIEKCCDMLKQLAVEEESKKNEMLMRTNSQLSIGGHPPAVQDIAQDQFRTEQLIRSESFVQVFVSAVVSLHQFYVQLVGPQSTELDRLVESMTQYYSKEVNRRAHPLAEAAVGAIVASPFSHDGSWYRAQVTAVNVNDYDVMDSELEVFFVDFGDRDTVTLRNVCALKPEFVQMKLQAIECRLASVESLGSEWDVQAQEAMIELTHCTQWVVLMARVESIDDDGIPRINLVDTSGNYDVDIAAELVKRNLARGKTQESHIWKTV